MLELQLKKSPLQKLNLKEFNFHNIEIWVKRDDLIHDELSGNKWRKLKHNLTHCMKNACSGILTFGGAHSNHIIASAFLCKDANLKCTAIIRGEEPSIYSPTLLKCKELGMNLIFTTRSEYQFKDKNAKIFQEQFPDYHIVPEGGANELGIKGCEEIITEIEIDFDYITVDCGTGATLSGMVRKLKPHQKAIGVQVLKGNDFITEEVVKNSPDHPQFEVWTDYHFGGYAKNNEVLLTFMRKFYAETGIKLDPIYTGKQFYAVFDQISKGHFPNGSKIILTHTGGLQGIEGFEQRYKTTIY